MQGGIGMPSVSESSRGEGFCVDIGKAGTEQREKGSEIKTCEISWTRRISKLRAMGSQNKR